jgi:hypothetical protein
MRCNYSHMCLVVKKFALFFGPFLVCELSAADRIPDCDLAGLYNHARALKDQRESCLHHYLINHFWISIHGHRAILINRNETR